MLIQFTVENHRSIKNSAVISFAASKDDTMLLGLNFFRRDQIWFAEKDDRTCATELYSLVSFSPRIGGNVRKGYLQGRFGAIPFIGGDAE